ncbi:MAG TPA: type VI secretion system baseplate subunit TssG, partial [Thermoanaerobaculia bacterium]|nr:type VI secretion system baseplate subunit TssG [Thermoanaerobaculia bacterium]
FRLVLGPLTLEQFRRLLPAGPQYAPLMHLARFVAGPEFDFDVQLVLKAGDVPDCTLGPAAAAPPMLGWTTWLKTLPFGRDDSQVRLAPGR